MYGPNLSSVTIGAVKYTKCIWGRKLNSIGICHMYSPMWEKSRSTRLHIMLLNIGEYRNCTGKFVPFIPAVIKLHLHMYHEKSRHCENNLDLVNSTTHVTERTACSCVTNLIKF